MFKFKEAVTGFIYNTEDGYISEVFTSPIPSLTLDGVVLFTSDDLDEVLDLFSIKEDTDLVEGFEHILEKV